MEGRLYPTQDLYKIGPKPHYIHSHFRNFASQIELQNIDINLFNKEVRDEIIMVLQKELKFWTQMRKIFIDAAIEANFLNIKVKSPKKFLEEYNKKFNEILIQDTAAQQIFQYKDLSRKFIDLQDQTRGQTFKKKSVQEKNKAIKNYQDFMESSWEILYNIFSAILNYVDTEGNVATSFFNGEDLGDVKKEERQLEKISKRLNDFQEILEKILIFAMPKSDTQGKTLRELLKKFKENPSPKKIEKFLTASARVHVTKFIKGKFSGMSMPANMGNLLEAAVNTLIGERIVGDEISKESVSDIINLTFKVDGKRTIKFGTSLKLTKTPAFKRKYVIEDPINAIKNTKNKNILEWLRANIQSLNVYNLKPSTKVSGMYEDWLDMERDLAGLYSIPRTLNGVYEDINNQSSGKPLYHTALINIKNEFYWTSDILETILSELEGSLKTNYTKDLVEFSEFENTLSPSDSELQKLWEVKKNTFKKLDIQLYENLKKSKGVNSQLKSLSSLYKTPYADGAIEIKLGWIRQQMKK